MQNMHYLNVVLFWSEQIGSQEGNGYNHCGPAAGARHECRRVYYDRRI